MQENVKQQDQDLSQRIEKLSTLEPADQDSSDKIVQVKNNLNSIKTRLHTISAEYSELVEIIKLFLISVNECRENIENYFNDKKTVNADSVENIASNYELFKNTTMEHFRSLLSQSEQIIERIKIQEPNEAKEHDTDRIITLLERLRTFFETQTESENSQMQKQHDLIAFDKEVNDINCHISDLSRQLKEIDGCYGYNLDNAKANLQTFDYLGNIIEVIRGFWNYQLHAGLVRQFKLMVDCQRFHFIAVVFIFPLSRHTRDYFAHLLSTALLQRKHIILYFCRRK